MRKCYLERDVCGEHVWNSEERNVIWNQTNRNWNIFTSFALTWKYTYKKTKQVKLMITWIPTKILFNCNYKAYLNKNLCCRIENQSKPPLPMNENSCRLIKNGKHCMQSSWCWYKWEKHFIYKETTDKKACGPEGEECWTLWRVEWMKKKKNPQTNKK